MIGREGVDYPFKYVKKIIKSHDLAFCNLECPVPRKGFPLNKKYCFRADSSFIEGVVNAGFDIISIANNHTLDWDRSGFTSTQDLLLKNGLYPVGGGKNQKEARRPTIVTVNGLKFAFFAFMDMLPDAIIYLEDKPGPAYASTAEVLNEIERVKNKVDFIIVSIHWGIEFNRYPRIDHVKKAHKIIDAGADMILGHHPHVLQSVEVYKKRPIIYSLGNFVFDQHELHERQSAIFECIFRKGKIDSISLFPVLLEKFRPKIPGGKERGKIAAKIKEISGKFKTNFIIEEDKIFLKVDSSCFFIKPITFYRDSKKTVSVSGDEIKLADNSGKTICSQCPPNGKNFKDCCFISDSLGLHLYGIIGDINSTFGERIFTATVTDTGLIGPFLDPHTFYPWKIMKADVDGDNEFEICAGVWKSTRYDAVVSNRLFIYNRRGPYIYPKWLGSRVNSPLIDFDFRDINSDGIDELLTLELNEDGSNKINLYQWFEFGFDFIKTLKEKQEDGIISVE